MYVLIEVIRISDLFGFVFFELLVGGNNWR